MNDTAITRYPDWPIRLNAYINSVRGEEFEMGVFDCCTFTAGCVKAITGEDYMSEFRDKYDSVESGAQALKELGDRNLYRTIYKKFGPSFPGVQGQIGDLAFFDGCCGIVLGRFALFLPPGGGFSHVRITYIQRSFRVGR